MTIWIKNIFADEEIESDDNEILKDGDSVRVSLLMCDSPNRAITQAPAKDSATNKPNLFGVHDSNDLPSYAAWQDRVKNAWRKTPVIDHGIYTDRTGQAAYENRIRNAWRRK